MDRILPTRAVAALAGASMALALASPVAHAAAQAGAPEFDPGLFVLFSGEPNYEGWAEGTQFLLANALVYPQRAAARTATDVRSPKASVSGARDRASVGPSIGPGRPLRLRVPAEAGAALAVVRDFTATVNLIAAGDTAVLEIPNPEGLSPEEHPFSRLLLPALTRAGIEVLYAAL